MTWTRDDEIEHHSDAVVIARNTAAGEPTSEWLLAEFRGLDARRRAHEEEQKKGAATPLAKVGRDPRNPK